MSTNEISPALLGQISEELITVPKQEVGGEKKTGQKTEAIHKSAFATGKEQLSLSKDKLEELAKFLDESSGLFNIGLQFKVSEETDRIVVSVINRDTEEVIRQIPPQEVVDLAGRLKELAGVLFNETA